MKRKKPTSYPAAFPFVVEAIHAIEIAARNGTLPMQSDNRRWYRDEKCQQLQLLVTPSGAYFYRVSYNAGKRHKKKLGSTLELSLSEARQECKALQGGNAAKRHRAKAGERLAGEVFAELMEAMKEGAWSSNGTPKPIAERTARNRVSSWRKHVEQKGNANLTLSQFAHTIEPTFKGIGKKKSAANLYLIVCTLLYRYAADQKLWDGDSPLYDSRTGTKKIHKHPQNKRTRFLPLDQVGLMFAAADAESNPVWGDYWRLSVLCGARMGNMLSMRWKDLDLNNATWSLMDTKTEPYTIGIPADAVAILKRRRKKRQDSPYVFPSVDDPQEHMKRYAHSWDRLKKAVPELDDTTPHDVRRTCGSLLTIAGVPLPVVAQQLGHVPGSQATAIYTRLDIAAQREAANILNKTLKKLQ